MCVGGVAYVVLAQILPASFWDRGSTRRAKTNIRRLARSYVTSDKLT